jgi:hypothetical protein
MNIKRIGFIVIIWLLTIPALASELANSFAEAAARGDAQEKAVATKAYFTDRLLPYYGQKYGSVLQSCFATVTQPNNEPFAFVAALAADGKIVRLYNDHETNIYVCMREALIKDVFPAPPESPFYLHIKMKFDDKVAPQNGFSKDAPPLIMEPNKYSYTFGVPKGWEFSFEQAQERGARLAFFPKGGSFNYSSSVIYVIEIDDPCTTDCKSAEPKAIAKIIRESKEESPLQQVITEDPIKTKDGDKALIRLLKGSKDPRQSGDVKDNEALAFIGHDEAIILVILTVRDAQTWDRDYSAFQEIVAGHRFFTCNSPDLATPCGR